MDAYRVTDGLMFVSVCVRGWSSVCVFGEKVQPVLQIALTVTGNLHPLTLTACNKQKTATSLILRHSYCIVST